MINNLPVGKFVIGDNAYVCGENLLNPFSGAQSECPSNSAYNY